MRNAEHPKYIAFVDLLKAAKDEGLIPTNPLNPEEVLIYREGVDEQIYGATEGLFSMTVYGVAQELMAEWERGDRSFADSLAESGYAFSFTDNGDFGELTHSYGDVQFGIQYDAERKEFRLLERGSRMYSFEIPAVMFDHVDSVLFHWGCEETVKRWYDTYCQAAGKLADEVTYLELPENMPPAICHRFCDSVNRSIECSGTVCKNFAWMTETSAEEKEN